MMLIIADKSPNKAVDWLVKNTNKNFCFKQLLELGQLVCSVGMSDVFKPIKQGLELQKWCYRNICWVYEYFDYLYHYCCLSIKMKNETKKKLFQINRDLHFEGEKVMPYHDFKTNRHTWCSIIPQTAIWRYNKEYKSEYPTNSELSIDVVTKLYKDYVEWKLKQGEIKCL